jgi:hypothetical protein
MTRIEVSTETDLAPELVWAAVVDFTEDRPRLWPLLSESLYKVHSVEPGSADVQEGSKTPLGKIWAREKYTWDDDAKELRATVAESSIFRPGGTGVIRVLPREGGGSMLHESYDRERIGLRGKIMNVMLNPKRAAAFIGKGRERTFAAIRERPPRGAS